MSSGRESAQVVHSQGCGCFQNGESITLWGPQLFRRVLLMGTKGVPSKVRDAWPGRLVNVTRYTPDPKRGRALPLQGKIGRIARFLPRSSLANAKPDVGEATSFALEVPEETITQFIRVWRERNSYLPSELLLDPAWGMLLELLQAEIQDRSVSLARLCKVSGVSASSAVRWLKALEARELAVRRADPENANNEFVELSKKGSSTLRRYFHDILQSSRPFEDRC